MPKHHQRTLSIRSGRLDHAALACPDEQELQRVPRHFRKRCREHRGEAGEALGKDMLPSRPRPNFVGVLLGVTS